MHDDVQLIDKSRIKRKMDFYSEKNLETSTSNTENLDGLAYNAIPLFHYPKKLKEKQN